MLAFVYLPPQMKVSNFDTSIFTLIQSIPTDHASTPPHLTAPLRLDAFTVAMSLRVMVAVKTRAKPLSVTWPHSSFELSCAAHALQALLGPTRPYIQGPTGPAYSLKDLKDLERIEVSRPVWGGPSQTGSVSYEKSGMTHSIPHLRKNSLLEGIGAMPFWHPGDELCSDPVSCFNQTCGRVFGALFQADTFTPHNLMRYFVASFWPIHWWSQAASHRVVASHSGWISGVRWCRGSPRMALEMQYTGFQRGYEIGFPHFTMPAGPSPESKVCWVFIPSFLSKVWIPDFTDNCQFMPHVENLVA